MGFAAIFVLGRPAELVRPLLLARKCRMPVSSMFGIYVLERLFDTAGAAGGWRGFVATQFAAFSDGLQAIRGMSDWWAAVTYSVLHWGLIVFIYQLVIRGFGGALGELTFSSAMLVLAFTMMGSLVQLP